MALSRQKEMPVTDKIPTIDPVRREESARLQNPPARNSSPRDDGTNALLQGGFWILLGGLLLLLLAKTVFGGIGIDGAHTDAGWLSLVFALMAVPFGLMLLVLGIAKWLRNRRLRRAA